jgi:hypothetical protein
MIPRCANLVNLIKISVSTAKIEWAAFTIQQYCTIYNLPGSPIKSKSTSEGDGHRRTEENCKDPEIRKRDKFI